MKTSDTQIIEISNYKLKNSQKITSQQQLSSKRKTLEHPADTDSVSHILSDDSKIPLRCDHCGEYSGYSLSELKDGENLSCSNCLFEFRFSAIELQILKNILEKHGYHFKL